MKTGCIVTRYNETIDWIEYIQPKVDIFYIYNKGENDNLFKKEIPAEWAHKIKIQKLPNVGRIDHTIAYHILNNWDTLEDIIVSLPGSILMCYAKGSYLSGITKRIEIVKDRYRGFFAPRFSKISSKFNYSIDNYQAEGLCNRNNNLFIKSEYPDFQAWKTALIDTRPMRYVAMRGMFAVCRENIKYIDRKIYENLLTSLSVGDNIENGHFAERIWAHLFRQYSFDTLNPDNVNVDPNKENVNVDSGFEMV
jgi:hypothetical protein